MVKVYAVFCHETHEGQFLESLWFSKEAAYNEASRLNADVTEDQKYWRRYEVEDWKVN